jgi:hypothetical protein
LAIVGAASPPTIFVMIQDSLFSVKYLIKEETAFTCSSVSVSMDSSTCLLAKDIPWVENISPSPFSSQFLFT